MTKDPAVVVVRGFSPIEVAEAEILVDGGPLCVGPAWDFSHGVRRNGLYFIYQKKLGFRIGPFYPHIPFAAGGMKKALEFGKHKHLWTQDLAWYQENLWIQKWLDENLGKHEELFGGRWVDEEGKEIRLKPVQKAVVK